jgi:hypothetical protein
MELKMKTTLARVTAIAVLTASLGAAHAQSAAPVVAVAPTSPAVNRITGAAPDASWEEEFAYTLGVQAYIHHFPWLYLPLLRYRWATFEMKGYSAPTVKPGVLTHQRRVTDATYKDGGRPNNDTLYSALWLDLSKDPVIIRVPDFGKRYYSFEIANWTSDNYDYIGTRATGGRPGDYLLAGPNWKGEVPKGVHKVASSNTPWVMILLRILSNNEAADVAEVHRLQDAIEVMPLARYLGDKTATMPEYIPKPPLPRKDDPLADWKNINIALAESPLPAHEAQLAKMYAQIGIGPGLDVTQMNPAIQRGLARAAKQGAMIVTSAPHYNVGRKFVNGWGMTPLNWGRNGLDGMYLMRAAKTLGGIIVADAEENTYPATYHDHNGELLQDARKYAIRFEKNQIPPVDAFWSLTMYGPDLNLVDNPINRYSIGDRTKGLKYGDDGSLTIYIQKDDPLGDKTANWLPSGNGYFHMLLRTYLPRKEVFDGRWTPPPVRRVD